MRAEKSTHLGLHGFVRPKFRKFKDLLKIGHWLVRLWYWSRLERPYFYEAEKVNDQLQKLRLDSQIKTHRY